MDHPRDANGIPSYKVEEQKLWRPGRLAGAPFPQPGRGPSAAQSLSFFFSFSFSVSLSLSFFARLGCTRFGSPGIFG